MTEPDGYVPHDELLQGPGELLQALRLRHQVVLQALSAQPFAFLEHDGPEQVS